MKKQYLFLIIGLILIGLALYNITLDINNKGHYFGNGVFAGIGFAIIVVQLKYLFKKGK